jgi:hypothetical protein
MTQPIVVNWDTVKSEWYERGIDSMRDKLVGSKLIPDKSLDSLSEDLKKGEKWQNAFETSGGATLLAYFVFVWGMSMWELTSDHKEVRKKVAEARAGYLSAYHRANDIVNAIHPAPAVQRERLREYLSGEQKLVYLIFNSLTIPVDLELPQTKDEMPVEVSGALLLDAMGVESAVYSASVVATQKRANAIRDLCETVLKNDLIKADGSCDGIRGLLRDVLGAHRDYYGCIARVAEALRRAARADPDATSLLDTAIEELAKAQEDLGEDVYASELPPYRVALTAWRDRLTSQPVPTVLLDSVNITYIYPFALSGVEGEKAREIALDCGRGPAADGLDSGRAPRPTFGGLSPSEPAELQLTDMWTWGGRRKELHATINLPMPSLTAELRDDDDAKSDYDVELRFNELGNHYLRVDLALEDPTLNDMNQALRRATTYSGEHAVTSGDKEWATIADYANDVITDVAAWITAEPKSEKPGEPVGWWTRFRWNRQKAESATAETEPKDECGFNPDFDYHVVVVIHTASVLQPDGSRREATKEDIEKAYGKLLLQLLNRETTTLDEWICWSKSQAMPNLLGHACFPSDFAIGTESTTVLYMPSTPSWAQSGYEEVAEFAASFPPLIRQWKNDLDNKLGSAEKFTQKDDDSHIDDQEAKLERLRSDLHVALEGIREVRTYLVPSQLLSLHAEGAFLEHLYRQSRLPELRKDIDGYLERGRITIDRMNTRESRLHDHRNRKYQEVIQYILFAVGTFSFSGVVVLFLEVWYGSTMPGWDTDVKEQRHYSYEGLFIVIGIYSVFVLVGFLIFWYTKRRIGARRRRQRG